VVHDPWRKFTCLPGDVNDTEKGSVIKKGKDVGPERLSDKEKIIGFPSLVQSCFGKGQLPRVRYY